MASDYIITFADETKTPFVIKPYTANGPEDPGQPSTVPLHSSAVSANTSLVLFGKGMPDYGQETAKDLVRLLENFANDEEPAYLIEGQIWYKNDTGNLYICIDPAGATFADRWNEVAVSGGLAGDLDMGGFKIINLGNPTNPQDAMTLAYADATYVNVTGDIMSGLLILSGDPTNPLGAATKQYVDGLTSLATITTLLTGTFVLTAGDTMTGNLVMSGGAQFDAGANTIINVATPVLGTDAANKDYVDATAGGGADGVVDGGSLDPDTGVLSLTRTLGLPDVTIPGISPLVHDHNTQEVFLNADPFGSLSSRIREVSIATNPNYPTITLADALSIFDNDLFNLRQQNARYLVDVPAAESITGVSTTDDYFQVSGDFSSDFLASVLFEVTGSTGNDGTYTTTSSRFSVGTTTIYVAEAVASAVADGSIERYTYVLPSAYMPERAKLMVTNGGTKQYASERGYATVEIQPPYPVAPSRDIGTDTGLEIGSYTFDIAVDGAVAETITVTVSSTAPIAGTVTTGLNGSFQVAGDFSATLYIGKTFRVVGSTGNDGVYLIGSSSYDGSTYTTIVVAEDFLRGISGIIPDATADGDIQLVFTYEDLTININYEIDGTAGYEDIIFSTAKALVDATGLANDATVYTALVNVDGVGFNVMVTGSAAQTFTTLLTEINADLVGAVASLEDGNIRITSSSNGVGSNITIIDVDLFATLTNFDYVDKPHPGLPNALCVLESSPTVFSETTSVLKFYSRSAGNTYGGVTIGSSGSDIVITDTTLFAALTVANPDTPFTITNGGPISTDRDYVEEAIMINAYGQVLSNLVSFNSSSTTVAYVITAVTTGLGGKFTIAGNHVSEFPIGERFVITGSTNNNGTWTVSSYTTYAGGSTIITVTETVGTIADGSITSLLSLLPVGNTLEFITSR